MYNLFTSKSMYSVCIQLPVTSAFTATLAFSFLQTHFKLSRVFAKCTIYCCLIFPTSTYLTQTPLKQIQTYRLTQDSHCGRFTRSTYILLAVRYSIGPKSFAITVFSNIAVSRFLWLKYEKIMAEKRLNRIPNTWFLDIDLCVVPNIPLHCVLT